MAGLSASRNKSLRENTGSIVRTDIPVGPFPAGPTHDNDESPALIGGPVGKGSIFHRRATRPDNRFLNRPRQYAFLPPIFIPNSPLTITLPPASPPRAPGESSRTKTKRDDKGGSPPLAPPATLLACLPDFPACSGTRCGSPGRLDYHVNGEELDLGRDGAEGKDEWGYCHLCGDMEPRRAMHKLPCGHLICSVDLEDVARGIVETAQGDDDPVVRRAIDEAAFELGQLKRYLAPRETMPDIREYQEERMEFFRKELLNLLGLSCCGKDMNLVQDWLLCLDERLARKLGAVTWRLFRGGSMDGTMYCGWCDAAIPLWCSYNGWDGDRRWYCVACEGNSMFHLRNQDLWPAR